MIVPARIAAPCVLFLTLALPIPAQAQEGGAAGSQPVTAEDSLFQRASQARARGNREAALTVFELSDFQCPYCARFTSEVLPQIERDYIETGKVLWVFVHYPLPIHAHAWTASEAATCAAGAGGDFWTMHDTLFAEQRRWTAAPDPGSVLREYAMAAGAEADAYDRCVTSDQVAPLLTQDLINAAGTGASGTPAFVVGQKDLVVGIRPYEEWKELLDKALAETAAPGK